MTQSIEVCGYNEYCGISERLNSNRKQKATIYPPIKSKFSPSSVLSYSTYGSKTVVVTIDGIAHCIGDNRNYEISCSLFRQIYEIFTDIELIDKDGDPCFCISAVCGQNYTLYLISDGGKTNINKLSISWSNCISTYPLILNTGSSNPVALFGGIKDSAAIDDEGRILYVSEKFHLNPKLLIEAIYLPNKEKAVSVVMCSKSVLALSSCGHVYETENKINLSFKPVPDLKGKEFVRLSGIDNCVFVINAKGRVFVRGSNDFGRLGLKDSVNYFTEILSLRNYKIVDVFVSPSHSFFKADNGTILASGSNTWGELLIENGRRGACIYNPTETIITDGSFVISSVDSTVVFKNFVPSMIPNKQITFDFKASSSHPQKPSKNDSPLEDDAKEKEKKPAQNEELINQLENDIDDQRRQIEELKNQLTKEIKEKIEQKDYINMLENQMNNKNDQIKELQNQLANEMKEKEYQRKQIEELKNQIKQQSKEINAQKTQNEELADQLNKEKEDKRTQMDVFKKQLNLITNSKEKNHNIIKKIEIIEEEEFNKIEKIEKISSGGFGEVYKTTKTYAMKVMKIDSIGEDEIRYFLNEYELINLLDHPNIIKTFGIYFGNKTNPPSILLEFCQMNLDQAIKNKILSKTQIIFSIYQIVEGMKFVHFNKIIHRDLKPSNILIALDGTIKISDFGISKLMSIEKQSSMTKGVGTYKYMAPEIIDDDDNYNEKVDVYSFGVLLFFIINEGNLQKIKPSEILRGMKADIPSFFTEFSKKLINDCLNFDSKKRPSFAEIITEIEKNDFGLLELDKSELDEVKLLIAQHQEKIPFYSK